MSNIRRERWARLGPLEVGVSMPVAADRWIAQSPVMRRLVKPLIRRSSADLSSRPVTRADINETLSAGRPSPSLEIAVSRPLLDRVAEVDWRQTIEVGHEVVTPGRVDQRDQVSVFHLPESLSGVRCLDVNAADGFWAFEMERRGAADIVAVVEPGCRDDGFRVAQAALDSQVKRKTLPLEDLSESSLGRFDLIVVTDVLARVRDPQLLLDRIRSLCVGTLLITDVYHAGLEVYGEACLAEYPLRVEGEGAFWHMSTQTIMRMLRLADFGEIEELGRFEYLAGGRARKRVAIRAKVMNP